MAPGTQQGLRTVSYYYYCYCLRQLVPCPLVMDLEGHVNLVDSLNQRFPVTGLFSQLAVVTKAWGWMSDGGVVLGEVIEGVTRA